MVIWSLLVKLLAGDVGRWKFADGDCQKLWSKIGWNLWPQVGYWQRTKGVAKKMPTTVAEGEIVVLLLFERMIIINNDTDCCILLSHNIDYYLIVNNTDQQYNYYLILIPKWAASCSVTTKMLKLLGNRTVLPSVINLMISFLRVNIIFCFIVSV